MNRKAHVIGAVVFGLIGLVVLESFELKGFPSLASIVYTILHITLLDLIILIAASIFGGVLPDILDPPFSSRHRKYAHSKFLLYFLIFLFILLLFILKTRRGTGFEPLYYFILGYISHLVLDSTTPAGLY